MLPGLDDMSCTVPHRQRDNVFARHKAIELQDLSCLNFHTIHFPTDRLQRAILSICAVAGQDQGVTGLHSCQAANPRLRRGIGQRCDKRHFVRSQDGLVRQHDLEVARCRHRLVYHRRPLRGVR